MSSDATETNKRKRDTEDVSNVKSDSLIQQPESCVLPSKRPKSVAQDSETDSDTECISQEDLLAQLGLNSVKKIKAEEANAKRVIHPEPPKRSVLEFLKRPASKRPPTDPWTQLKKEKPLTNGCADVPEDGDVMGNKEELIVRLQNNLRNEEAKLLLLRKLYSCQNDKGQKEANSTAAKTTAVTTATNTHTQSSIAAAQRRNTQITNVQKPNQIVHSSTVQPRVVFLNQPRVGQPISIAPKLMAAAGKSHVTARDTAQRNVRPQVSVGQNSSTKSVSSTSGGKVIQRPQAVHSTPVYTQSTVGNKSSAPRGSPSVHDNVRPSENGLPKSINLLNIIPTHTAVPQQSHNEAKMALRKQLERTLLQIPLPKPPAQDWNFVPSVNTQDFTILIGLEGVVTHIAESKELSGTNSAADRKSALIPPKFCSECDTDFTPAWRKKQLEGATNAATLCETCYTQKIKKSLKIEHTTRLKAAFVKALKQEQEVEQKYQSVVIVSKQGKADAGKSQTVRSSSHTQIRHPQGRMIAYHQAPIPLQAYPQHHSIVHQLQQQQLQQQELEAGHHQDTRYFTYVGQHNCQPQHKQRHTFTGDNDRQREYLLDMIPSGHSSRSYRI